jgi:uncharacterized membrane protein YoaK (UPF0700 family)
VNAKQHNRFMGMSLGFIAGYVDTLGYIGLFGLFTAHVTGNFVLIGASLADPVHAPILLKFLAFPAFIGGVASARLMIVDAADRHTQALTQSLVLQLVLLCGFMFFGIGAMPTEGQVTPSGMVAGLLGAAAMGAHSATSRLLLSRLAPTSMMTGNVTQVVIDAIDAWRHPADGTVAERCVKFIWPLLAFAVGAIIAAFGYRYFGFFALLVPIVILCAVIAAARTEGEAAAAAAKK